MNASSYRHFITPLTMCVVLVLSSLNALADSVDNIYYPQPDGTAWLTQSVDSNLSNPTAIESFDAANEFVITSPAGVRNYYFSENTLNYFQISTQGDYTSIADLGNQQAAYVAVGANGRVDRIVAPLNDWETTTILPANTLTGNVRVESYDSFGLFVTLSNEGVRYYESDGDFGGQISDRTDYVAIADNAFGSNNETFFALAGDGSVDRIKYDGATAPYLYSTTSILPAGSIAGPKDIESYDGNNEFVTVGSMNGNGIREYYFSGGNWVFDQMSTSDKYFAIADNGGFPADYFALKAGVTGDYNGDGTVDSADYVLWRKTPENFGGEGGYDTWRQNFGNPQASGGALSSSADNVPEPGIVTFAIVASLGFVFSRRTKLVCGQL